MAFDRETAAHCRRGPAVNDPTGVTSVMAACTQLNVAVVGHGVVATATRAALARFIRDRRIFR